MIGGKVEQRKSGEYNALYSTTSAWRHYSAKGFVQLRTLIILFFILALSISVYPFDVGIVTTITPSAPVVTIPQTIGLTIQNYSSDANTFILTLYQGGAVIDQNSFNINANENKVINWQVVFPSTGFFHYDLNLSSPYDLNSENNGTSFDLNILNHAIDTNVVDTNGLLYNKQISIRGNCNVTFDNGDKFQSFGITTVPTGGIDTSLEYCFNFTYTNSSSINSITKMCARAGSTFNATGRIINITAVSSDYIDLFVVSTIPLNQAFSDCQIDVNALTTKYNSCIADLSLTISKMDMLQKKSDADATGFAACSGHLIDCTGMKSSCESNLTMQSDVCNKRVTDNTASTSAMFSVQLAQKDSTIMVQSSALDESDLFGGIGWVLFLGILISFCVFEYFMHYKKRVVNK